MVDVTSDPALMLDFKSEIEGIPTIDLDAPTTALGHSSHQHTVCDESFSSVAPSHTGSGRALATSSTSVL